MYQDSKRLFKTVLKVKDADIHTITAELLNLNPHEQGVAKVKGLLFALNRFLSNSTIPKAKMELLSVKEMFPIWHEPTITETEFYSAYDYFWIPDRKGLSDAFKDRIPLLDLDLWQNELENIRRVLTAFDLDSYLLSNATEEDRVFEGESIYNQGLTDYLRAKVRFIV